MKSYNFFVSFVLFEAASFSPDIIKIGISKFLLEEEASNENKPVISADNIIDCKYYLACAKHTFAMGQKSILCRL